jgi:hypothetical protein
MRQSGRVTSSWSRRKPLTGSVGSLGQPLLRLYSGAVTRLNSALGVNGTRLLLALLPVRPGHPPPEVDTRPLVACQRMRYHRLE